MIDRRFLDQLASYLRTPRTLADIAARWGYSTETARTWISRLEQAGYMVVWTKDGRTTYYQIR